MKCVCGAAVAVCVLLFVGCGKKEPEKTAETKESAASPAEVQAAAKAAPGQVTLSKAVPKAASVPETPKAPAQPSALNKPAIATSSPTPTTAKDIVLTDALIKNWVSVFPELKKLALKSDADTANVSAAVTVAAAAALEYKAQADALMQKHGMKDLNHFMAVNERLVAAFTYTMMKKNMDEAMKDLSPDEKALIAGMMKTNLEQFGKMTAELGITREELNAVSANMKLLEQALEIEDEGGDQE